MPTALFILATLFWGVSFIFIKVALNEMSPLSFIFFRFLIASVSLLPMLRYQREKIGAQDLYKGSQLGSLLGAVMLFQTMGMQTINASTAAFLVSFTTVFVLMIRFLVQRKIPGLLDLSATLACIGGLSLVTSSHGIIWELGVFYALLAAFFMALYIYAMEAYVDSVSLTAVTLVQMLWLALLAGLAAITFEGSLQIPTRAITWGNIAAAGVLCSSLAFGIQAYAQQHLSAFKIAMMTTLEPVFATIFSWLFLGEVLHISFYLGAVLILGAIVMINWRLKEI